MSQELGHCAGEIRCCAEEEAQGVGSVFLGTVRLLPGRGCLSAARWSSFPVPVCFLMVPRSKQPITGRLLPVPMRLFPATSRWLPGTWCTLSEAVYELSASGCGFVDTSLGIHGSRSKHPGTLGCFTAPVRSFPRQHANFPTRCGRSRTQRTPFPPPFVLTPAHGVSLLEPFASVRGRGTRVGSQGALCCAGDGFVGTRSGFPRPPRRLLRRPEARISDR